MTETSKHLHPAKMMALATTLACGVALPAARAATFNAREDVKAINAIEETLETPTSMKTLIHYYAPDATVVDIYTPGIYRGRAQIYPAFENQFKVVRSMGHHIDDMNVATHGDFACAASRVHFDTVLKSGVKFSMSVRQLDAYKRIGGQWQLIMQHTSLPVDAKTGLAVMDGKLPVHAPIVWAADQMSGPAETPEQAKADIRHWMDVGTLSTNIDQLMGYYGPGDDVLVYDTFFPGEIHGRTELRQYYTAVMGSYDSIKVKMPMFVADSDGLFGVQSDTQDMQLHMKDGSTKYISLRQSDCMRREGGKWYSFFEMISFPIDPKTNKAVMENPTAFR